MFEPERPGRRMLLGFLACFAAVVAVTAGGVASAALLGLNAEVDDILDPINGGNPRLALENDLADVEPGKPQNILLIGSDERYIDKQQGNPVRSDTMILARLDPERGATGLLNIPRDLKVQIDTKRGQTTEKINAAFSIGGPRLSLRTVSSLLKVPIHHVVVINFGGFRRAVNRLNCIYTDVDRRYFNDNNPPFMEPSGQDYAVIDVPPGYQKLCGQDALDYVRYRHLDTDQVRNARQQDFLRQAKEQVGVSKLLNDRKELLRIVARYTETDIDPRNTKAILRLLKLAYESSKNPIRPVRFRVSEENTENAAYLVSSPEQLQRTKEEFQAVRASSDARGKAQRRSGAGSGARPARTKRRRSSNSSFPGTTDALARQGEDQAIEAAQQSGGIKGFPVMYPKLATTSASYVSDEDSPRTYTIEDRGGNRYRAYRLVVKHRGIGQYYGIQGTSWTAPPILDNPDDTERMRGREYLMFYEGKKLRLIGWRTDKAAYWVSNTLLLSLTNKQMRGIARSLTRIGS